MTDYDDTARMPQPDPRPGPPPTIDPYRHERVLLVLIGIAYLVAGAVLGIAVLQLSWVVDQIQSTPLCRRI